MARHFGSLVEKKWDEGKMLCVGLDSEYEKLPDHVRQLGVHDSLVTFNRAIIDATKDIAGSYKFNSAFYEERGDDGLAALRESAVYAQEQAPDVPIILDAKRADIGNTNRGYMRAVFDHYGFDAITVHPYLGAEALAPFLEREDKGIIVLCRTSNPGAGEFQDLDVGGEPLYMRVARNVTEKWNVRGNCMLVVGATYPEEMQKIRAASDDIPFLIPGIGAQGGDVEKTVRAGRDSRSTGMLISASRSIIFASSGTDYAEAAGAAARVLDGDIRKSL
jgi:orotidine-5'-phosphate decarboxylase